MALLAAEPVALESVCTEASDLTGNMAQLNQD